MKFNDVTSRMAGHLEIYKRETGSRKEELVWEDKNVIVSGMGVGLAHLFTGSGSNSVIDFQIDRFQVGVSGDATQQVSSTYELSGPISSINEYGRNTQLFVVDTDQIKNGTSVTGGDFSTNNVAPFGLIPASKVTRVTDNSVRYTIVLDEQTCVQPDGTQMVRDGDAISLNEIGLFMKNPTGAATDASILVAYRHFSSIPKTDDYALIFRWTLEF